VPGRVHSRRQFDRLEASGRRGRSGPLRVLFLASVEPAEAFGVAYAISRRVGNAVRRNRIRRQLRSIMDEFRADLQPGLFLIKCDIQTKDQSYDDLARHLGDALGQADALREGSRRAGAGGRRDPLSEGARWSADGLPLLSQLLGVCGRGVGGPRRGAWELAGAATALQVPPLRVSRH
jgi:ribonuclease P protein component